MMHFTIPPIASDQRSEDLHEKQQDRAPGSPTAPPSKCPMFVFAEPIINLTRINGPKRCDRELHIPSGSNFTSFQVSPTAYLHDKKITTVFPWPSVQLCRQDGSVRGFRTCTFRTAPTSISLTLKKKTQNMSAMWHFCGM